MIAVDTNVLVYAHRAEMPLHEPALAAISRLAEGRASWAVPWPCLHEFLAIATHPRIFDPPTPLDAATGQVAAWLESPTVSVLGEGADHWLKLLHLLQSSDAVGPRVHDARVAAICLSHGISELWSLDRDYSRFPALRTTNPLV
ncbi:MAG: PIN domain-containing protein [Actinomycetota bacterium]|nr:PIN domain-containing protein [Actinomycetota bacterium]